MAPWIRRTLGASVVLIACGGQVSSTDGAAPGAAAAPTDGAVLGTRCLGAAGEIVRASCLATGVSSFTPSAWVPPAPRQGACTAEQIDDYYWHCFSSSADPQACDAFHRSPANDACASCIVTPDTAPLHGPLVSHDDGKTVEINVGGCVALARGGPGAACGASVQAVVECTAAACATCSADANGPPRCQCETAAQLGACRTYVDAAACVTPYASAGNSDLAGCLGGMDFQTRYTPIVRYFCLAQ